MKAYEIQKYGGPEGLRVVDRPMPDAGEHDVVVRIKAASLNFRDLVVVRGQYDRDPTPGRVPLSDGAGEVVAIGRAVTRFKAGEGLNRALEQSKVRPVIDTVFPFESAPEAYHYMASGSHFGKVVIKVGE
jgi:NADPH:quinone reductase-like Zn-dependent oxidoreductase